MEQGLLPKNFFKNEPLEEMSTAIITHFSMTALFADRLETAVDDILSDKLTTDRKVQIAAEKEAIARLAGGEEAVRFIRKGFDILNRVTLCKKLLTMQEEVMPPLLRRFRTSFQDEVVETTAFCLAHGELEYVEQLKAMYGEIRNPYAQSMACLIFGMRKQEDMLPLLLKEYQRMKEAPGEEKLCQGPLLAIYILFDEI